MTHRFTRAAGLTLALLGLMLSAAAGQDTMPKIKVKLTADDEKLIKSLTACLNACVKCANHCAAKVNDGDKKHSMALRWSVDCGELCVLTARSFGRHGPTAGPLAELCARTCDACARECEGFDHAVMKDCARECKACAAACRERLKQLKPKK